MFVCSETFFPYLYLSIEKFVWNPCIPLMPLWLLYMRGSSMKSPVLREQSYNLQRKSSSKNMFFSCAHTTGNEWWIRRNMQIEKRIYSYQKKEEKKEKEKKKRFASWKIKKRCILLEKRHEIPTSCLTCTVCLLPLQQTLSTCLNISMNTADFMVTRV